MSDPERIESLDRRLHRLYDGDLSAEEEAALEKELASSSELGKKLEGLREVGVVVRAARTDDGPAIDGDALWKAIEAEISVTRAAPEGAKARPALRAIDGGAERAAPPRVEDARARRRRWIGIGVGAFAIAAAALLMIYGPPSEDPTTVAETTPPDTRVPDEATAPDPTDTETPTEVASSRDYTEVLAVDFGTNVGTIFAVEGEGGQRYAVVWLDDVLKRDEGDAPTDAPETPN